MYEIACKNYLDESGLEIDPRKTIPNYGTILHLAVKLNQSKDLIRALILQGCDVNALSESNNTALHYAARIGRVDIAKLLLEKKADLNARTSAGATALIFAVENGHKEIVDLLLQHDAETSHAIRSISNDSYHKQFNAVVGDTALHLAVKLGKKEIEEALLQYQFSDSIDLIQAVANHKVDVVDKLLKNHIINFSLRDKSGRRAIDYAYIEATKYHYPWLLEKFNQLTPELFQEAHTNYVYYKDSSFFGARWLASSQKTKDVMMEICNEKDKFKRFKIAKCYVEENRNKQFAKELCKVLPSLTPKP